ncbi:hypothetical protein [Neobacillus sp. LXY-4]|uniref:hypothetical protein n=1 Tax=Neobacillus sp. LXY-4 TaxID=3379826 RepID=UPI003EDF2563
MNDFSNDPYDNEKVHQTICDPHSNFVEERTPFNDVVKHNDIIQGFKPQRMANKFRDGLKIP